MTMIRTLMLAAAAAAIPLGVAAENKPVQPSDIEPLHRMGMHVNAVIWLELTKIVPAQDALRLAVVAEQAAIAASCTGYDLDADRFGAVMNRILEPVQALVAADKNNLALDFVMNSYSTIKGGGSRGPATISRRSAPRRTGSSTTSLHRRPRRRMRHFSC
ncbi:MAG: hypothetical protein ACK4KW_03080 [Gemmobacter sp.]